MPNIVVLGSGMAGFGAAYRLHAERITPVMYDKNAYHGGHTASFRSDTGFLFDVGPHISFTKDLRIQEVFADSVAQQYETIQINMNNYADWLVASLGRTFAELFPMQYTRKYHLTIAENMSTDWLGSRIYRPTLEEVLRGALSPSAPHVHYITHFRYPSNGGFMSYLKKFIPMGNLRLNHELVSIDPRGRQLTFSNGHVTQYDGLVSSVALPDLIRMIQGAPADVVDASRRLACSTCVLVNVGVNRQDLAR